MAKKRYSLFRAEGFGPWHRREYHWVPFGPRASYARTADRLRRRTSSIFERVCIVPVYG